MMKTWVYLILQGRERARFGKTVLLDALDRVAQRLAWLELLYLHGVLEIRRVGTLGSPCELVYSELKTEVD